MKKLLLFFIFLPGILVSQVKITDNAVNINPHNDAMLHVESGLNKGVILPIVQDTTKLPYYGPTVFPDNQGDNYGDDPSFAGALAFAREQESFYVYDGERWKRRRAIMENPYFLSRFVGKSGPDDGISLFCINIPLIGIQCTGDGPNSLVRFGGTDNSMYGPLPNDAKITVQNDYRDFVIQQDGTYAISTMIGGRVTALGLTGRVELKLRRTGGNTEVTLSAQEYRQASFAGISINARSLAGVRVVQYLRAGDRIRVYFVVTGLLGGISCVNEYNNSLYSELIFESLDNNG
jgi:hypothetical protein